MSLTRDSWYTQQLASLTSEPPFYWQRAHLELTHLELILHKSFDVRDVVYALSVGLDPRDAHDFAEAVQEMRAQRRRDEEDWDLWNWADLLQKLSYKPGWHCQILLDPMTPRIEFDTIVTMPNGARERLGTSVALYLHERMPNGARRARRVITSALEDMERKIMQAFLRYDGHLWTEEKDVP
ncbi:hypothetical protein PBI_ARCHERS7_196 [Mycobacterium phage ArcherS7]|uniref:Uncharacterized protein n=1 Tax=Mycobacterium phage ArcherS7 TaxID=1327938 RepID=R4TM43_9CAUD|nr:hypothetical protein M180_gp155 [Mycobacterium phage ArcherS7]AGM13846.1 hypothetical protein PBI_ARCHERS7_196 [Mycobacterium phage ArcherS7]QAY08441.1 hypothetical protein SEA_IOTA_191 [Mycobacterium phage Iota]